MSSFHLRTPTLNPVRPEPVEGMNGAQNQAWRKAAHGSTSSPRTDFCIFLMVQK